jgi:hypothetical protein
MNTGIGDAVNLAWKLADVLRGRAPESILASYEPERSAFAHRLVATTDRAFAVATSPGCLARFVRVELVPRVLPALFRIRAVRRFQFRALSQTALHYRASPLSAGRLGGVRGGDRLPWVEDADNHAALRSRDWQVHVYGAAAPGLESACRSLELPLRVFDWRPAMRGPGLTRDAHYLVRPDGHVALVDAGPDTSALLRYASAILGREPRADRVSSGAR